VLPGAHLSDDRVAYFAYGSCMNHASLAASLDYDVTSFFVGPAQLIDFALRFNYPSINAPTCCCANIEAEPGAVVEGALYDLPRELMDSVDRREGVSANRYSRTVVPVQFERAVKMAFCYRGSVTLPYEAAPSERYRELLTRGLLDSRVSEEYRLSVISKMASLPART